MQLYQCIQVQEARSVMGAALSIARRFGKVSAVVVDIFGHVLCGERMEGADGATFDVAVLKCRAALAAMEDTAESSNYNINLFPPEPDQEHARIEHLVRLVKALVEAARHDGNRRLFDIDRITWAGGVLLWYDGQVVGALGISGLKEEEDHAAADEAREHCGYAK